MEIDVGAGFRCRGLAAVLWLALWLWLGLGATVVRGWAPFYWPGSSEDLDGDDVLVKTKSGTLLGKRRPWNPEAGGNISQIDWFLGIPYAAPPVGELRFKPTRPVLPWSGVRNATRCQAACPQREQFKQIPSDEDCLTLNIYRPYQESVAENWPVMVYIHGGSYRVGTGASFLGNLLAQRGVIVITINYRLGILGFMSARHRLLPGNNGLLDQIEALKWINENVRAFGGDPERITIFGNSAGGASVGFLTVSPLAAGLFQQSVIQSGSPFAFWAMHNDTVDLEKHTREVAKAYNCVNDTLEDLVTCLRSVPAEYLGQCSGNHIPSISVSNTNFRPHVDGHVIPHHIEQLYKDGEINADLVMIGVVEREWSQHIGLMISELMWRGNNSFDTDMNDGMNRTSFEEAIRYIFCDRFGWGDTFAKVITHEYTNWTHREDPIANRETYISFMTDFGMVAPTVALANVLYSRRIPVYIYQFNHKSNADEYQWKSNAHLMELYYIFGAPFFGYDMVYGEEKSFSREDREMSIYMMDTWAQFAKFKNPSLPSSRWDLYIAEISNYLSIRLGQTRMKSQLNPDGVAFWNDVIPSLQRQLLGSREAKAQHVEHTLLTWLLCTVCVIMGLLIVVLSCILYKVRKGGLLKNGPVSV